MPDSTSDVYLHFVWSTKWREPVIPAELERDIYRIIHVEAERLGGQILAIGGMPDHIHLLVKYERIASFARFMNFIKGTSSKFINDKATEILGESEKVFRWQNGYAVSSAGRNQVPKVIAYIENQKQHHAAGTIHARWEPSDDTLSAYGKSTQSQPLPGPEGRLAEGPKDRPFRVGGMVETNVRTTTTPSTKED